MNTIKNSFSFLQKIGKSLMLVVAVLPVAGLLLGIGSAHLAFLPGAVSDVMAQAGGALFSSLPVIFAIGTALGLANNDGVSALSAVVGYMVLLASMGTFAKLLGQPTKSITGIESIDTGVFGGLAIGMIAAYLFNRFYRLKLPDYLGFFAGKRSVPILTAGAAIVLGGVLSLLWPPIGSQIQKFSIWAASENPLAAFTLYGFVERLMIPFGLHHIWNMPFFFEAGHYVDPKTGKELAGEIARYIAGDPTAGNLAGGYLFKMWGLPAAALAIWRSAKTENQKRVGGIMISAALTSFLTGITEPIEFSFMFVAPVLYLAHAMISASAYFLCILLGIKHGMTFSHGLIDFVVLYPQSRHAVWFFALGPLYALIYYGLFSYAIRRFNLKTPGREDEAEAKSDSDLATDGKALEILKALGGSQNIVSLDACVTRLRLSVKDQGLVNEQRLKALGARGVLRVGEGVQAIFGPSSENIKTDMEKYLSKHGGSQPSYVASSQVDDHSRPQEDARALASDLLTSLGGRKNIRSAQAVAFTRVRVELNEPGNFDFERLNEHVSAQLIQPGLVHLLVGEGAPEIADLLI